MCRTQCLLTLLNLRKFYKNLWQVYRKQPYNSWVTFQVILRSLWILFYFKSINGYFVFSEYNQKDATFLDVFTSVRRSICFRRIFLPSSVAQNCTYGVRYWSDKCLTPYVQFWAPDDGRAPRLKHLERFTEINILRKLAFFGLYSENILAMHGHVNVT